MQQLLDYNNQGLLDHLFEPCFYIHWCNISSVHKQKAFSKDYWDNYSIIVSDIPFFTIFGTAFFHWTKNGHI